MEALKLRLVIGKAQLVHETHERQIPRGVAPLDDKVFFPCPFFYCHPDRGFSRPKNLPLGIGDARTLHRTSERDLVASSR